MPRLKTFACQARTRIKAGVARRLAALGFTAKGKPTVFPRQVEGGTLFNGQTMEAAFYDQWTALHEAIRLRGVEAVCEEVAYTWFNRFMAISILQHNGFADSVLAFDNPSIRIPYIVSEARAGRRPTLTPREARRLDAIIADATRTIDQFRLLIVAFCHATPLIHAAFGHLHDYTELLLPDDILDEGGFIDMLNRTDAISDDDYRTTELLGWLYQFYIAERKDEVFESFRKAHKAEADDIPAATQIFTPRWIVRYMVENTLGRTYLSAHPDSLLRARMPYLVEAEGKAAAPAALADLRILDPACGSGHILLVAFDLLFDIYADEYYSARDAVSQIFAHNLLGIDIDTRARQLATFALMLRAAQHDPSLADDPIRPRVLDMDLSHSQEGNYDSYAATLLRHATPQQTRETADALRLCAQARNLGSIMHFSLAPTTRQAIAEAADRAAADDDMLPTLRLILALTDHYTCVVANPPYMGSKNMNAELARYVKDNYGKGKADLCTAFILKMQRLTATGGKYAFIVPPSWLFLSTFEALRTQIVDEQHIDSMLHLSRGVFGADFGSVATVISNCHTGKDTGTYLRLVERTFQEFEQDHLRMLFEQTLANHDFRYRFKDYTKEATELPYSADGNKIYYDHVPQSNFEKIPGKPIGYWVSEKMIRCFEEGNLLNYGRGVKGLDTGDDKRFLRLFWEINPKLPKWKAYNKGGAFRRWYGNWEYVINWENDGHSIQNFNGACVRNKHFYFRKGIEWSRVSSNNFGMRYIEGSIFGGASQAAFIKEDKYLLPLLAFYNCVIVKVMLRLLNPTMIFQAGDINRVPIKKECLEIDSSLVSRNISISRQDWDAHETSWDFKENELVTLAKEGRASVTITEDGVIDEQYSILSQLILAYKGKWEKLFHELHANEEELNRQFISIYGLEDELTADVPLEEVTILQQGEISIEEGRLVWHDAALARQLVSYAMGCIMGRYRLDRPGLAIAHPSPTAEELAAYGEGGARFEIDDDAIVPLMGHDSAFSDNAPQRIADFVRAAFGAGALTQNLNTIEAALGKSLDEYMRRDFWADHKQRYHNRPIYWLFRSRRGAFQALAYMHRMDAYTVQRVRQGYLLKHLDHLLTRQADLLARQSTLTATERRTLAAIGRDIDDCREYDTRLHAAANLHLTIDLDDGVAHNLAKMGDIVEKIK